MGGWTGKLVRVDLTTKRTTVEAIPKTWLRKFLGGRGLAARYFFEEVVPTVDPFAPENKLIFATGPLTGTNVPCASRYMVVTKGALTGAITTSNSGGFWGPELKFAGYDLLIVEGRADRPSYLLIYDEAIEIRDASEYWGRGVWETDEGLRRELGLPDAHVACIGPAGENRVRFAAILNDKHRAAGRSGVGAVMGSKNLKAVVVRGTGGVTVAEPQSFFRALWKLRKETDGTAGQRNFAEFGTPAVMDLTQSVGGLPTRNFQKGQFERADQLNGVAIRENRLVTNKACFACTVACGRVTQLNGAAERFLLSTSRRNWRTAGEGPEYESAWALGVATEVGDLDAVIKGNWLCNDLGLDPISMGATLAAAMELYEKGVVTDEMVEVPLRFGSADALLRMIEATALRRGFGDVLAEGSKRMTERFGHPEVFMGSKGQEFPAYDPRAFQGMGVAYATSNRGACHLRAWTPGWETSGEVDPHTPVGKGEWVANEQNCTTAQDSLGVCLFLGAAGGTLERLAELTTAVTGEHFTYGEFVRIGERIWNLERLWNLKAGLTRKDDSLPERLLKEAFKSGPSAGVVVDLDTMLAAYYKERGWDENGVPTAEKLQELGLADL